MSAPISRETIEQALKDAHVPTLMLALVHLTGDDSLIGRENWPRYTLSNTSPQGGLPDALQDRVRALAADVLHGHLNGTGGRAADRLAPETVTRMMNFAAGATIPPEYLPFGLEQLQIDGIDAQAPVWTLAELPEAREGLSALIIGAGMSGLLAALRLKQAGIPFRILEKNPALGGTWHENTYPGCRVDSSNYTYSYSFDTSYPWPEHFSQQKEILGYFQSFAEKHQLIDSITCNADVEEARFDSALDHWVVTVRIDGQSRTLTAPILIAAVGQLNRPALPDIPGRKTFAGPAFHTAQWRHDVDLTGKTVAVIGTGASAFQVVPAIADEVGKLLVYQRSAPWLLPTPEYHDAVTPGMHWLLENVPFYEKWYRFYLFWLMTDGTFDFIRIDPDWTGDRLAISKLNDMVRQRATESIVAQLPDDPALLAKVLPTYHYGGKRAVRDNGVWIRTLKQPHVALVTDPVRQITPRGIVTADGVETDVDVIVYGTGFQASRFLHPLRIIGRDGVSIAEAWDDDARAFLGALVPAFPNLFILYGPNTNIVVNGSVIFMAECTVHYMMGCIERMARSGASTVEVRKPAYDRFNDDVETASKGLAWGAPHVNSWYKNAKGRVVSVWPFRLIEYWQRTRTPGTDDLEFR